MCILAIDSMAMCNVKGVTRGTKLTRELLRDLAVPLSPIEHFSLF